ncbi:MAG: hypothetical protein LBL75_04185 [Rickettsiales bacterium]|jgi:uncharacterized protein with NRDE domain|nr:hypothetical protein [Rickettsiales bacterium]
MNEKARYFQKKQKEKQEKKKQEHNENIVAPLVNKITNLTSEFAKHFPNDTNTQIQLSKMLNTIKIHGNLYGQQLVQLEIWEQKIARVRG